MSCTESKHEGSNSLHCTLCGVALCKRCAQFAGEDVVEWLEPMPAHFHAGVFCSSCFERQVAGELAAYQETLALAEQVNVFYKSENRQSRFVRRQEKPLRVEGCLDRESTLLKLAFRAAQQGFNLLVDVEMTCEKVRLEGWQTSKWKGSGIPAHVDPAQLERRFVGTPN